jgi:hypothetical protein
MLRFFALVLWLAGVWFIFSGFQAEARAVSAMHQIYGAVYMVGGVLCLGIGGLCAGLAAFIDKLPEQAQRPPASDV